MKNTFLVLSSLLIMFIIFSSKVYATDDDTEYSSGHFYYHSHDGYVSICGYLGRETDVKIPAMISGRPVSEIESGAFDGCDSIRTITIPDTVVMVYDDSFTGASSLKKIVSNTVGIAIVVEPGVTVEYAADAGTNGNNTDKEESIKDPGNNVIANNSSDAKTSDGNIGNNNNGNNNTDLTGSVPTPVQNIGTAEETDQPDSFEDPFAAIDNIEPSVAILPETPGQNEVIVAETPDPVVSEDKEAVMPVGDFAYEESTIPEAETVSEPVDYGESVITTISQPEDESLTMPAEADPNGGILQKGTEKPGFALWGGIIGLAVIGGVSGFVFWKKKK